MYSNFNQKTLKSMFELYNCKVGLRAMQSMRDRKHGCPHSMAGWLIDSRSEYPQASITGTAMNGYTDGLLRHCKKGDAITLPDGKTEKVLAVACGASKKTVIFNNCVVKFNKNSRDCFGNQVEAELQTWLKAVKEGWSDLLCPIVRGGCVRSDRAHSATEMLQSYIVQAKADCEKEINLTEYNELVKNLRKHGVVDQHRGNVAYYNDRLVSIDYGLSR